MASDRCSDRSKNDVELSLMTENKGLAGTIRDLILLRIL